MLPYFLKHLKYMIKYNLKDIKKIGDIVKIYGGKRLIYNAKKLYEFIDEIDISFRDSLTYYLNDEPFNKKTVTVSPLHTSLEKEGYTTLESISLTPKENITRINHMPDDIPENIILNNNLFKYYDNIEYINVSNLDVRYLHKLSYAFSNNPYLKEIKLPDFTSSTVEIINNMFYNDKNLQSVDLSTLDGNNIIEMQECFNHCNYIKNVNLNNFIGNSATLNMSAFVSDCLLIKEISMPKFEGINVNNISFSFCQNLERIYMPKSNFLPEVGRRGMFVDTPNLKEITLNGGKWFTGTVLGTSTLRHLRKLTVYNFGKALRYTPSLDIAPYWGVDGDGMTDCKKSLIDTLITYSVPVNNITIKLSPNTKAVLTKDEIAAITSKGYTIA